MIWTGVSSPPRAAVAQTAPAKLRLAFEAAPFSLLVEKAGGKSSDAVTPGGRSILDVPIEGFGQRARLACHISSCVTWPYSPTCASRDHQASTSAPPSPSARRTTSTASTSSSLASSRSRSRAKVCALCVHVCVCVVIMYTCRSYNPGAGMQCLSCLLLLFFEM